MQFKWNRNTCEILFNEKEKKILNKTGKLTINYKDGRTFVNHLAKIVAEIHLKYKENNPDYKETNTEEGEKVETN